jgi:hypothetical protein
VVTGLAVQVHGGMGYVEETGMAQHYRDARITTIYEGTNGIQAADLVGRKLPMRSGGVVADHIARMRRVLDDLDAAGEPLAAGRAQLAAALDAVEEATRSVMEKGLADPNDALAASTPYLRMLAVTTGGWLMARQAVAAVRGREAADDATRTFLDGKLAVARFFLEQLLPEVHGHLPGATASADVLFAVHPSVLSS